MRAGGYGEERIHTQAGAREGQLRNAREKERGETQEGEE